MKGFAAIFAAFMFIGVPSALGQKTVTLTQIVLTPTRMEIVGPAASGAKVVNIKTSNEGVATAFPYRANQVQIVAVAYGKTNVEFFDTTNRILYIQPVWVEKANSTGGGGSGYNPRLAQLPQIVMLVNRTENAHTPNDSLAKISGVASSNEKVATARIDPPRGIQISSKTLGDTWINFTNNTTGITYQVHVWVTNVPKLVTKSSGPGPNSDTKPLPNPKPKPLPLPVAGLRNFDACLVGKWLSESPESVYDGSVTMDVGTQGLAFVVKSDATATFDYSGVKPVVKGSQYGGGSESNTVRTTVTGKATARISDNRNHNIIAEDNSLITNVTFTESYSNGTAPRVVRFDNTFFFGEQVTTYSCTADKLVLNHRVPITFRKVE